MPSLGASDRGSTTEPYALYAALFDARRAPDLDRFLADALQGLLAYDAQKSTRLVPTLSAWFEHSGNLTRTAAALHIHLNTLLKRLERVTSILGTDWREPDRALRLQVALRLHALRSQLS
ncbi:hypothetical protein GCM10009539_27470 [Cryptosporangium japonicum]|uniref:PucR C-terminal helix-turn-helix domain-containing protein n=2 Tax=Cryptosporangium japonicum TaxID=80872 RepID=A0ABN0U6U9_9ACTN